jgi:hypothetical protein
MLKCFDAILLDYVWEILYVYYLSKDMDYNKDFDLFLKQIWYARSWLYQSYVLYELKIRYEYEWMGVYYKKEKDEEREAEKIMANNLRKWHDWFMNIDKKSKEQTPEEKLTKWEQPLFD